MAKGDEEYTADEKVQRSVGRTLKRLLTLAIGLALLGLWGWFGAITVKPGQAAVLLMLGAHTETITSDGLHFRIPPPLVTHEIVNVSELRNQDFGFRGREDDSTPLQKVLEATMQTGDNNIVRVSFAVQYTTTDAFLARYRLAEQESVVHDAAQAAMREVVGRMTVDDVLREKRALVASEVSRLLQDILDSYESGLLVEGVQLQDVQPPAAVRAAFDGLMESNQDANTLINEAEGYRNQVIPQAKAEALELIEGANGYRDAKIADAIGEAGRFSALLVEYEKAPEVTRKRLYLETMESVLPNVEKIVIESGTTQIMPYLPLGKDRQEAKQ